MVGACFFAAAITSVWAADPPPDLSQTVRASLATPSKTSSSGAMTSASQDAMPSDPAKILAAPPISSSSPQGASAAAAAIAKAVKDSAATPSSDGISIPGVGASTGASLSNDQDQLERQAEEAASKAAAEQARKSEEHNHKSYDRAQMGLLPLSGDQVRQFMHRLETTQNAAMSPYAGTPKGEVRVVGLSLDPGGESPQINLAAGFVTTIDIVDASGEPWPILDVGVGGNFEVTPTQAGSHVVRVVPLTRVGVGNLSILLKDLSTPIIFRLTAGGPTFHMRYDARVPRLGPNAKTPLIAHRQVNSLVAGDQTISMILENAPPKGAKRLKIGGVDSRTMAWKLGDKVYVRTSLSLLSPAWNASASSSDGMSVYEIGEAPVLLMSDNGAMVRARIMQEDEHDK